MQNCANCRQSIAAGTATVTRAIAKKINETAAPGDVVSGEQLRGRVRDWNLQDEVKKVDLVGGVKSSRLQLSNFSS